MLFPYKAIVRRLFRWSHVALLTLRYRIRHKNLNINDLRPETGMLLLSNHTSHFDPLFTILFHLARLGHHYIWVSDFAFKIYYIKLFDQWMEYTNYMKVPTHAKKEGELNPTQLKEQEKRLRKLFQRSADFLNRGSHVLIHASGHSKKEPREVVGKTKGVKEVLKRCPHANIVLVRHTGMWGSRFSQALKRDPRWKNENQKWQSLLKQVAMMIVLNGIFFIPKRKVEVEYVVNPPDFPRDGSSEEINAYLEKFYNANWGPEGEPFNYVPDFFWQSRELKDKSIIAEPQTHH